MKRYCYKCRQKLDYSEAFDRYIDKFDDNDKYNFDKIWNSKYVQFLCCHCNKGVILSGEFSCRSYCYKCRGGLYLSEMIYYPNEFNENEWYLCNNCYQEITLEKSNNEKNSYRSLIFGYMADDYLLVKISNYIYMMLGDVFDWIQERIWNKKLSSRRVRNNYDKFLLSYIEGEIPENFLYLKIGILCSKMDKKFNTKKR